MQITASSYLPPTRASSDAAAATADAAFARLFEGDGDPRSMLAEITRDGVTGMMKWKVRELEKKIAREVLAGKNLTMEDIAAMPPKERIAVQQQIMREVAERLKEAMNEQMRRENRHADFDAFESPLAAGRTLDISA